jgi:hypothetical protein
VPGEDGPVEALIAGWRAAGVDWVVAIERCGPASDGVPRNMRRMDISAYVTPLDRLFSAGPWRTVGIGDGGNELGMGSVAGLAGLVPGGEAVACVVKADALVTAGVSHWGAYGLLAALTLLRPDLSAAFRVDPAVDRAVIEALVRDGPAVDGVTRRQTLTVDGLGFAEHHAMLAAVLDA